MRMSRGEQKKIGASVCCCALACAFREHALAQQMETQDERDKGEAKRVLRCFIDAYCLPCASMMFARFTTLPIRRIGKVSLTPQARGFASRNGVVSQKLFVMQTGAEEKVGF